MKTQASVFSVCPPPERNEGVKTAFRGLNALISRFQFYGLIYSACQNSPCLLQFHTSIPWPKRGMRVCRFYSGYSLRSIRLSPVRSATKVM